MARSPVFVAEAASDSSAEALVERLGENGEMSGTSLSGDTDSAGNASKDLGPPEHCVNRVEESNESKDSKDASARSVDDLSDRSSMSPAAVVAISEVPVW
eukprot:CAMPEP_0169079118 /NCGR_PEP_ID=MMETSP1015-20121227/9773_1 /TAXON_ID=342587 /ORGANISM="Karlodinium micrum, Strain CCMP2283" /LENGTH=99 /DNA_ID=CAMNT_0009138751 /DNA_START=487 /DNA_END=782 /DNA_ORIENTATION=+